jgi:hypothetical protein
MKLPASEQVRLLGICRFDAETSAGTFLNPQLGQFLERMPLLLPEWPSPFRPKAKLPLTPANGAMELVKAGPVRDVNHQFEFDIKIMAFFQLIKFSLKFFK